MVYRGRSYHAWLLGGAAAVAMMHAGSAAAQDALFDIAPQPLASALNEFSVQSRQSVLFTTDLAQSKTSPGVSGQVEVAGALSSILDGTGLTFRRQGDTFLIVQEGSGSPQGGSAAGGGATVEALIVTAQKREEDIQDVPIAISAFSQEDLTRSQIAGGPDLITQVPNMTFTKTNFSSYSVQLRGIGTQAISATTDPAVAVAFNNTPFIRNRFFEQEFYDLQRVEVLRGPQGTLYGRNATAGVVNIISAKPKFVFEAKASADLSNYSSSRIEGMVNIPLVEDAVALRVAGAWTRRDGYAFNQLTGAPIDGRDLWSTRVSLRVSPNDRIDANLIWEHFEEDDDRLRSGKQLCKKDIVTEVAGFTTSGGVLLHRNPGLAANGQGGVGGEGGYAGPQAVFSQGCERESLYSQLSFQRPQGYMLPYYLPLGAIGLPTALNDPYLSVTNSTDFDVLDSVNDQPVGLRTIQSTLNPTYRANNDLGELQISIDLTDSLTLTSETAYATDTVYSLQDFNRFNTAPGAWATSNGPDPYSTTNQPNSAFLRGVLDENGVFCDPQLGCSDRLVAVDISTATATQFSQELRLASDYGGPFNFSLGANFLRGDSEDKYYVFINSISMIAAINGDSGLGPPTDYVANETDNSHCLVNGYAPGDPDDVYSVTNCVYIDPNPIGQVNDKGHNYFLSKNPYKLISYAVFGEAYYNVTDNLKVTAGLRWTVDKKEAPRVPTWILGSQSYGYPVAEVVEQEWREPTGRLTVDWKPNLSFTDETLLYASYAHGYKAGGANPPGFVRVFYADPSVARTSTAGSATRPKTFDPEFIDAYELGAKNTLADGRVTLNLAAFYYDYEGYQVSEIVDRSAYNRNFDATVWGVELEADWRPMENLRFGLKGGYEDTRIKDGEEAVDLMDRTAGDSRWVLLRPFPTFASSCILPAWLFVGNADGNPGLSNLGGVSGGNPGGCELAYQIGVDPGVGAAGHSGTINYAQWSDNPDDYPGYDWPGGTVTNRTYPGWDPLTAPNAGEGIAKQLGGNELPNAPHWTWTVTGDYTLPLAGEWLVNLHTDLHWQAESYWRVFNDHEYDKLDEYFTMNLAAIFMNEEQGWTIMAYVKNVTNETAITGAFLNSDDTGLTTNVFLTEPRLYGLRVTKTWSGGPTLGSFGARHDGPYSFTVELGGQAQRIDAPNEGATPSFSGAFAPPLNIFGQAQDADLDWGDGREVKLTWRPNAGPWTVAALARFGQTNANNAPDAQKETDPYCGFGGAQVGNCDSDNPKYEPYQAFTETNWSDASVKDRESYELIDLLVGRDVGFGNLSRSTVSGGVRYARFDSTSRSEFRGTPDWGLYPGFIFADYVPGIVDHSAYEAHSAFEREFEGVGPVVTWDAAHPLAGSEAAGRLDLAWTVSAGVLFGDQDTTVQATEEGVLASIYGAALTGLAVVPAIETPIDLPDPVGLHRSQSATVPLAAASVGLSYTVDRFNIDAGYRWERYFDVLDGGFTAESSYDRTIDGPYVKVSVGFGG